MKYTKEDIFNFISVFRIYIVMSAFLIVVFLLEFFFSGYDKFRLYNALENILLATALISLVRIFIPSSKWPLFQSIVCSIVVFIVLLEGIYYLILDAVFSPSAIFIALDTNATESSEFFQDYFSFDVLFYAAFVVIIGFLLIRFEAFRETNKKFKWAYLLGSILSVIGLCHPMAYSQSFPYTLSIGLYEYWNTAQELNDLRYNKTGNFADVSCDLSGDEIYVVVIGESTNRNHMQLYGYSRNTNPKLNARKHELVVYKDVVSAHAYTIASLTRALSLEHEGNNNNIIQLLNAAEFNTFWLSNQAPIGLYETLITKIGMTAIQTVFTSSETWFYNAPYDEVLLPHFKEIVSEKGPKVVFVHLLGTHGAYYMRYPSNFKRFDPALKESKHPKVDHYDNAVYYNDYVVNEIINITQSSNGKSFVLYLSDHGEEVYDEIDYAGHSVDQNITKSMFEVPFILWQSKAFQEHQSLEHKTKRKFSLDNLSHAIADLCGVSSSHVDYTKSLFSSKFQPSPRIILDSLDYDQKFSK